MSIILKKEGILLKKLTITFCLFFLLAGCSNDKEIDVYAQTDEDKNSLQKTLNDTKEVYIGNAIFVDDELLVAVQVNPWIGFKERKIEKKLQKKLKKQYPNVNVLVSTDYKMYWETNQLLEEKDKKKISKEVKKLKDLAKEET